VSRGSGTLEDRCAHQAGPCSARFASILMDWGLYRERNVVERLVGRLKEYRRVVTRYDKLVASYLALVQLAAVRMWL
jgi:transposase